MTEASGPAIGAFVTATAKAGAEDRVCAVFRMARERVRAAEPGCLYYDVFRSADDPRVLHVLEKYANAAALRIHRKSPHVQEIGAALAGLLQAPPAVQIFEEAE